MHYYEEDVPLSNIQLSTDNPRFEMVSTQKEAYQRMIETQGDKIINLAKDIIEKGSLNPGELIYLAKVPRESNQYYVLEGNRRITALKFLTNPGVVGSENKQFMNRMKPLAEKFKQHPIRKIKAVIFNDPDAANSWIKLRHTGENDGVGTVKWDSQMVARFDERINGTSPLSMQAIEFLKKAPQVPETLKRQLSKVPATSLDRMLRDKNIQQVIGVKVKDTRLQTQLEQDQVVKGLVKIANDLVTKKIKVRDIYSVEDRSRYIETFKPAEIPDKTKTTHAPWELISATPPKKSPAPKIRQIPISTDRETLIPKDCIFSIRDPRLNKIYTELKAINVDQHENAVGVLFRVFIEFSIDLFLTKHPLPNVRGDAYLSTKVVETTLYMERCGMVQKSEYKGIRNAVSNDHNVLAMSTFNAYVHNRNLSPDPKSLKITWDNIQNFMTILFQNI